VNNQPREPLRLTPEEYEVHRRMSIAKDKAFMLWMLLGGVNAHLALMFPKHRWLILIGSIALFIATAGISGLLLWPWNWGFIVRKANWRDYEQMVRAELHSPQLLT
jgi:hypothetical protein